MESISEAGNNDNVLFCVEYPARVESESKMLDTLGGLDSIAKVAEEPNRRLELRFRPDDVFCKPACGEKTETPGMLLKIKRLKKKKKHPSDPDEFKIEYEVVGTMQNTVKFNSMCDFQYLPAQREKDAYKSIYADVFFDKVIDSSWLEEADNQQVPLFVPPPVFSRMDQPQDYYFKRDPSDDKPNLETPYNIIGRTRQRRSHFATFLTVETEEIPSGPREAALSQLKVKFITKDERDQVMKKFEEVPCWSKNALHARTGIPGEKLKLILPSVAYYFTNGPWRNQWIRFGYDPRKDPEAAKLQTLDYRVRFQGGGRSMVKAKRNYANYVLPYKVMNSAKKTAVIDRATITGMPSVSGSSIASSARTTNLSNDELEAKKDVYMFRKGRIPPYRQMFYQFKDLLLPEAQEIIASSRQDDISVSDEKHGWYKPGTESSLRDLLTKSFNEHCIADRSIEAEADNSDSLSQSSSSDNE